MNPNVVPLDRWSLEYGAGVVLPLDLGSWLELELELELAVA
jgi:hypothetical protein